MTTTTKSLRENMTIIVSVCDGASDHKIDLDVTDSGAIASECAEATEDWVRDGDWTGGDGTGARVTATWRVVAIDGREVVWPSYGSASPVWGDDEDVEVDVGADLMGSVTVDIDDDHAALIRSAVGRARLSSICGVDPDDHDWTSDGEGGCHENPGVWSTGGTSMMSRRHCRRCGLTQTKHTTGAQRNPGERDWTKYELPDEDRIEAMRAAGTMDAAPVDQPE